MAYYGGHGKLTAKPGAHDALLQGLLQASELVSPLEGCIMYFISISPDEPDAVLVTEVWTNKEAHDDSLKLESVRALISQMMPLVDGAPEGFWFEPVGGKGL